jgi:hypothetical protein
MKLLIPPTQVQLSTFLNSVDLISRFYNLFASVRILQQANLLNAHYTPTSGATVQITDSAQSYWAEILAVGTIATLTLIFPSKVSLNDGQEVLITTNQAVTALTLTAPGSNFNVAITTLAINSATRFKYSLSSNIWYKI